MFQTPNNGGASRSPFNILPSPNPPPFYARGGKINKRNLRDMAEMLKMEGTGGDSILAHINPEEAEELMRLHGGDINPMTGLPQFGFFDKAFDFMEDKLPWITSIVGNFVGGPLGGVIGGTIGGALRAQAKDKNMFRGAMKGAVKGGMTSAGIGAGNMLMGTGGSGMKGLLGMSGGQSTLGSMMGGHAGKSIGNLFANGVPGLGGNASAGAAIMKGLPGMSGGQSTLGSMMGGNAGKSIGNLFANGVPGPGGNAGAGAAIMKGLLGMSGGQSTLGMAGQPNGIGALSNMISSRQAQSQGASSGGLGGMFSKLFGGGGGGGDINQAEAPSMMQSLLGNPLGLALLATAIGGTLGAKKERIKSEEEGPPTVYDINLIKAKGTPKPLRRDYVPAPKGYRPGIDPEHVYFKDVNPPTEYYDHGGYIQGNTGGQADKINAHVSDGEYVMDADVVSALGDGNNEAGAKVLDKLRKNVRKHKRSAPIGKIPPKAKPLQSYMRNR